VRFVDRSTAVDRMRAQEDRLIRDGRTDRTTPLGPPLQPNTRVGGDAKLNPDGTVTVNLQVTDLTTGIVLSRSSASGDLDALRDVVRTASDRLPSPIRPC
jgi:hypothetical protein